MDKEAIKISKEMVEEAQSAFDDAKKELERAKAFHERVKAKCSVGQERHNENMLTPEKIHGVVSFNIDEYVENLLVENNGQTMKPREIIEKLKNNGLAIDTNTPSTVNKVLKKLIKQGKVESPGRALYKIKGNAK